MSLARGEEERNDNDDMAADDGIHGTHTEMPVKEAEKETEAKNGTKNKPIKSAEREEIAEASSSQPVGTPLRACMGSSPNCTLKPSNSFECRKTIFEIATSIGIRHAKASNPSRLSKTWQSFKDPKNSSIPSKPDRAHIFTISGAIRFSTPPHIPNINTTKRPPVTTSVFATTTPGNMPFAFRASTSIDPAPMISPAFVESNYEILKSLLRDKRSQIRNEDLQKELSPRVRRQRERVVGFEEAPNRERSIIRRNIKGNGPSEAGAEENGRREMNLPHFWNLPPNGLFADPTGYVTPFVRWIEDYPLPDGLKMPSSVGSYNGKGDPDNFLHLFEEVVRMQKWLMPVAYHMFTYTLKDSALIWWNSQKADDTLQILGLHEDQRIYGFVHGLKTRNLVEHLSTNLLSTYKGLMEKTCTWIEAREVATNGAPNDQRDNFKRLRKPSWDNGRGHRSRDREYSWPLGEVPLEITIGEGLLIVTKTLNFVIVRSDSPHNLLLGRTAMQQIGIVVSTIHKAIKFYTQKGIGTLLSENGSQGLEKEKKIASNARQADKEDIPSCVDAKEKIVVGQNIEFNADEMVIKRDFREEMLADIKETLERL
ncbi:hypothetical protein Tco_0878573 [Tanacetum coccineum]|uniref:Retrotransposon gag domain-containing protein n=1 Tax=Tanacetum coccineum TaxID=301880 RepID=A0ABQ5C0N0_9ASTR